MDFGQSRVWKLKSVMCPLEYWWTWYMLFYFYFIYFACKKFLHLRMVPEGIEVSGFIDDPVPLADEDKESAMRMWTGIHETQIETADLLHWLLGELNSILLIASPWADGYFRFGWIFTSSAWTWKFCTFFHTLSSPSRLVGSGV